MLHLRTISVLLCIAALLPAVFAAAQPAPRPQPDKGPRQFSPPFSVGDAVVSADGKTLAMISDDGRQVAIWRTLAGLTTDKPAIVKLAARTIAADFAKIGGKTVLVCGAETRLDIVDINTAKIERTINLKDKLTGDMVVAHNANDPVATYFTGSDRDFGSISPLVRINLATGATRAYSIVGDVMTLTTTSRLVAGTEPHSVWSWNPKSSPTGIVKLHFTQRDGKDVAVAVVKDRDSTANIAVDPASGYVAAGNAIYQPDGKTIVHRLAGKASSPNMVLFSPEHAIMFVINDGNFRTFSLNSFKEIGNFSGQIPVRGNNAMLAERGLIVLPVVVDGKSGLVMVLNQTSIYFSAADLGATTEPRLLAKAPLSAVIEVGKATTIDVAPLNPKVTVKLAAPVIGVQLTGNTLTFTATDAHIGVHAIALEYADGTVSRTHTLSVTVTRPMIQLPFMAAAIAVSPDGKRAVAYSGQPDRYGAPPTKSRLVVIDLTTRKILVDADAAGAISAVAIVGDTLYAAFSNESTIAMLNATDLKEKKTVATRGTVTAIIPTGDRLLIRTTETSADYTMDLRRLSPDVIEPRNRGDTRPSVFNDAQGILRGPAGELALWSDALAINLRDYALIAAASDERTPPPSRWGVRFANGRLMRVDGGTIGVVGPDMMSTDRSAKPLLADAILDSAPVMVSLTTTSNNPNAEFKDQTYRVQLNVHDLRRARLLQSIDLDPNSPASSRIPHGFDMHTPKRIIQTPDSLVISNGTRIYLLANSSLQIAEAKPPLHFPLKQSLFVVPGGKVETMKVAAQGGNGTPKYSVSSNSPAVRIDPATGVVTIDGPAVAKSLLTPDNLEAAYNLANLNRPAIQRAQQITGVRLGRQFTGMPVALAFTVNARDDEDSPASIGYTVVVDVPIEAVLAAGEQARKIIADVERQRRRFEEPVPRNPRTRPATLPDADALRRENAELSRRVQELEGQVRLLREMLQDGPATRP